MNASTTLAKPSAPPHTNSQSIWWKGAVIYQIYPRSFLDTNDDGVGDLAGILSGLEYVASLGVDGIWISPFFTSPMKDFGYDIANYCDVDPIFGTLADFDAIVERAHELGLKVIIDQVYSHTSDQHAWFATSRQDRTNEKSDWYVWADAKPDGSPPSNWQSVFGGPAWEWDARRKQFYLHNFLTEQPQLNVNNPGVQAALLETTRFWLERNVDGFRLDAINFSMHDTQLRDNPPSNKPIEAITRSFDMQLHTYNQSQPEIPAFLQKVRALLDSYGAKFTVAEVGGDDPIHEMKAFTHGEKHLNSAYNFDFLYAEKLTTEGIMKSVNMWDGNSEEGWPSWAFSNHDAPRAVSRWIPREEHPQASHTLMMLLLSLRGNPIIYQGEELGLPQAHVPFDKLVDPEAIANWPHTLGRDGARTPLPWHHDKPHAGFSSKEPWLPVDDSHFPLSINQQNQDNSSCLNAVKKLVKLRKTIPALSIGDQTFIPQSDGILVFIRKSGQERILCGYNLTDEHVFIDIQENLELIATEAGPTSPNSPFTNKLAPWSGFWARLITQTE
ncbi:alpha-glucosidase [Hirschia baltica]|uniref:Alpha amylase catalytic region n=1 Tax=Hirschia baltica (strain ATCC 49814 / DSM 5838 / IFAM 1418) TaxID=582402 RepID=C6XNW6_HIRBI|nr:alpha-glucosidase [Hirschia baltica]ACT60146.1 alpha amylase catalytic region [Hirschia baltica ATCC 49814]